jgi:hypothetical protein
MIWLMNDILTDSTKNSQGIKYIEYYGVEKNT